MPVVQRADSDCTTHYLESAHLEGDFRPPKDRRWCQHPCQVFRAQAVRRLACWRSQVFGCSTRPRQDGTQCNSGGNICSAGARVQNYQAPPTVRAAGRTPSPRQRDGLLTTRRVGLIGDPKRVMLRPARWYQSDADGLLYSKRAGGGENSWGKHNDVQGARSITRREGRYTVGLPDGGEGPANAGGRRRKRDRTDEGRRRLPNRRTANREWAANLAIMIRTETVRLQRDPCSWM